MTDADADADADAAASGDGGGQERPARDPYAVAAIVVGCLGILVFGLIAALVTAVLAGEAGRRAHAERRSKELALWALGLAALDGAFWIFLHLRFDLRVWAG